MANQIKLRALTIILYLVPILFVTILAKGLNYFLLSAGFMTVLLGLSMRLIPSYIGYRKDTDKFHSPIFIMMSGISLVLVAVM
ncbi:hypothetical protein DFR58_101290 [Anaerobacterium chartisolvens]|uniref:Uncharacterized protein n=1 Tax=Anaerobacterium chartisolvens TaxID=1297424 RepID=A0A369BHP3_9FIRM|nr:hypothetical protein [Anaerobacterium chartisolvens]RCX21080.1 hypothetical protein DFR58_101290 [Anaerobacterium chartisolvens]